jgi:hypothetical protein
MALALAEREPTALELPWSQFDDEWQWEQGEHITLVGPTGSGKTTLETAILPRRDFVVFLSTKRIDSTQAKLAGMGYKTIHNVAELHPDVTPKAILRPPWPEDVNAKTLKKMHAEIFGEALMRVFRMGYWTVVMDEARYLTQDLGLADEAQLLWLQGRSLKISVVAGTQRPRWIPLEAYDQATHLFFWKDRDRQNVDRVSEMAGLSRREVQEIVPRLERHEMLYASRVTDELVITKVEV